MDHLSTPILDHINAINQLAREAISGTNCLDPQVCLGACCYSSQEITFTCAKTLIDSNRATKSDFIRSDTLAFRIRLKPETKRCSFFDPKLNGCTIFESNLRPAQCCVFPIRFDHEVHHCRKNKSFFISQKAKSELEKLMAKYIDLAREEAKYLESEECIAQRLNSTFKSAILLTPPKNVFGVKDLFDEYHPLIKPQISFAILECCNIDGCEKVYEQCEGVCVRVAALLIHDLTKALRKFIRNKGPKEEYYFQNVL